MTGMTRRTMLPATACALGGLAARPAFAAKQTVRIGYQKYGNLLLLKASGQLETKLSPLGYDIDWKQFVAGPPLLEALGAGAIDFGTTGETPPIFAQAAGVPLVYLATERPAPSGEAIIVLNESPIRSIADLKGKTIAFNKGANVHYLVVRALESAGLSIEDVKPVYLAPPDGRAAFERRAVDAWAIWDPFLAAVQSAAQVRVIADGTRLVPNHQFYLRSRRFTDSAVTGAFKEAIASIDRQTVGDPRGAASTLAAATGIPEDVLATSLARQSWAIEPVDDNIVRTQQELADLFFKLGLIPKPVKIIDALAD